MGICCVTQGTQTGALQQPRGVGWGGRWEGGSTGRGHGCTYGWFMLMCGRNQHNSVKQWSIKKQINLKQTNKKPQTGWALIQFMNCNLGISGIDCDKVVTADDLEYYTDVQMIYYWNENFKKNLKRYYPWEYLRNWVKTQDPGTSPESKLTMINRKKEDAGCWDGCPQSSAASLPYPQAQITQ